MARIRKFQSWSLDELIAAARQIEEALVSGVRSLSYIGGGTVQQAFLSEYESILKYLYDAIDARSGAKSVPVRRVLMGYAGKGL